MRAPTLSRRLKPSLHRGFASALVAPLLAVLLALTMALPAALAQSSPPPFEPDRVHFPMGDHAIVAIPGEFQLRFGAVSPISIGHLGTPGTTQTEWELRPRIQALLAPSLILTGKRWPVFQFYQARVDIDARWNLFQDAIEPYLAEDPERQIREDWFGPRVTQAFLLAAGQHAAIKVGMMHSSWGTGMLANPGTEHRHAKIGTQAPPDVTLARSPFGASRFVDRVARFQVAFFPLGEHRDGALSYKPLTIALAGDLVLDDATANWDEGDRTYQGVLAIFGRTARLHAGLYGVYRHQSHAGSDATTEVGVIDATLTYHFLKGAYDVWLQGEVAGIFGSTTYARNVFTDGALDVASWGALFRFGFASACFEAVLEFGTSSGDNNPFDDSLRQFSFNREFRAGLLMFREVLRTTTAVGASNASDPTYRGQAPRGYERLASGGAIQGATFLFPRVGWEPIDGFKIYGGILIGSSTVDYTDPFWTGIKGGQSAGPHGATDKEGLGVEFDLALRYQFEPVGPLSIALMAEFAYYIPGGVFDRQDGTPAADVFGAWANLEATF